MRTRVIHLLLFICSFVCVNAALAEPQPSPSSATSGAPPLQSAPVPAFNFAYRTSGFANLTYHLDCMTGRLRCSQEAFKALWKTQLKSSSGDDEKWLERWNRLQTKYEEAQSRFERTEIDQLPFPVGFYGVDLGKKLRVAGLMADSPEEYSRNLDLILLEPDRAEATKIIAHFWPRFEPWWKKEGAPRAKKFASNLEALIVKRRLRDFAAKVAHFYETELPPAAEAVVHVIYRPTDGTRSTFGEQVERHSVVEIMEGERPEDRVGVVMHELFHYFYANSKPDRFAAFAKGLTEREEPFSLGAWNLANETLATALGNGLVDRRVINPEKFDRDLRRENSFYNESSIDRVAKALLPVMERVLEDGTVLSDKKFINAYFEACAHALESDLGSVKNWLRSMTTVNNDDLRAVQQNLWRTLKSNSVWGSSPLGSARNLERFKRYPAVSGVLILLEKDIDQLGIFTEVLGRDVRADMKALITPYRAFAYSVERNPKSRIYLLIGKDVEALTGLVPKFADLSRDFKGLGVAVQ